MIWGSHRKLDKIGMMYEDMDSVWFLFLIPWELVFIEAGMMFFPDPRWGAKV